MNESQPGELLEMHSTAESRAPPKLRIDDSPQTNKPTTPEILASTPKTPNTPAKWRRYCWLPRSSFGKQAQDCCTVHIHFHPFDRSPSPSFWLQAYTNSNRSDLSNNRSLLSSLAEMRLNAPLLSTKALSTTTHRSLKPYSNAHSLKVKLRSCVSRI